MSYGKIKISGAKLLAAHILLASITHRGEINDNHKSGLRSQTIKKKKKKNGGDIRTLFHAVTTPIRSKENCESKAFTPLQLNLSISSLL